MEIDSEDGQSPPGPLITSRVNEEVAEIGKWDEAISLRNEAYKLMFAVPRPIQDSSALLALECVHDFMSQIAHKADPTAKAARPFMVACVAINGIMDESCASAGLQGVPAAAKAFRSGGSEPDRLVLEQLQPLAQPPPPPPAEGAPKPRGRGPKAGPRGEAVKATPEIDPGVPAPAGAIHILQHLATVQRLAAAIIERSTRTMPFISLSLDENMIADRQDHALFFNSVGAVQDAFGCLFKDQPGDIKSLWGHHINTAGRMAHPARFGEDEHFFDEKAWLGSVTCAKDMLKAGLPCPDHPLPNAATLLLCFKAHNPDYQVAGKRARRDRDRAERDSRDKLYYLDKDTVAAIGLLIGDIVYKLCLHLSDVLPSLVFGTNALIPSECLRSRALTLGLFFHLAISYQSFILKSKFDLFSVNEVNFSFALPTTSNADWKKLVNFHFAHKNLGEKREHALPFLVTCMGLRHYQAFTRNPDAYLADCRSPVAGFLDEISGIITSAKERVKASQAAQASATLNQNQLSLGPSPPATEGMATLGMVSKFTNT